MLLPGLMALALMAGSPSIWGGDDFLALIRKAEARREPEERVEYLSRALATWTPSHGRSLLAACYFGRGEARYQTGDFTEALPDLAKALDGDPDNARVMFLRGRILLHQTLLEESPSIHSAAQAAKALADYVSLKPEDIEGLLSLGRAQVLAGHIAAAQVAFVRARKLAPFDPRPGLGIGRAFLAARDFRPARESLDAADALARGRDADILTERAACRLAQGDQAGALAELDCALQRHAELLLDLTRSRALPLEVEERQASAGRAHLDRGSLRESRGDTPGALADYRAGCRHGIQRACARAQALAGLKPRPAPPPPTPLKPLKKTKRRKIPKPTNDPGERIYGS